MLKELREFIHERLITTPTEETEMITHSEKMVVKDQQHQKKIEILRKEKTNLIQFYTDQVAIDEMGFRVILGTFWLNFF